GRCRRPGSDRSNPADGSRAGRRRTRRPRRGPRAPPRRRRLRQPDGRPRAAFRRATSGSAPRRRPPARAASPAGNGAAARRDSTPAAVTFKNGAAGSRGTRAPAAGRTRTIPQGREILRAHRLALDPFELKLLDAVTDLVAVHAEQRRGFGLVPAGPLERLDH